ncbi:MAG: sigma 54-interacting transcriptional regulator [Saprospiraceae bacterium]|nr:sigma 54-interacting transcriptional regulator [Saprospiraceae bacterium]
MLDVSFLHTVSKWFVEASPYDIVWADENANIIYSNTSFCNTLMYSKEEMRKLSMYDVNPSLTEEKWRRHWQIVKQERTNQFKTTHRKKNGEDQLVEVFSLFFSNNGKELLFGIIRDISESIYYRRILEKTEKAISVGGWKWNLMDETIIASQTTLCIFDIDSPKELLPAQIVSRFKEADTMKRAFSNAIRHGASYDSTLQLSSEDEETPKWVRVIVTPEVSDGKTKKIYGTYQDVTDLKEKEQSLLLVSETLDYAKDVIFWLDEEAKLVKANKAFESESGYTTEEIKSLNLFKIAPGFPKAQFNKNFKFLKENKKETITFEALQRHKNGTYVTTEVKVNYVEFMGIPYAVCIVRDITERKRREVELREALNEIKNLKAQLEIENEYLQEEIKLDHNFEQIICQNETYKTVLQQIEKVAPTESTILITGESGTGKELLARSAHQLSARKDKPLIKVNCATLPKDLFESELFGHKKGSFTGAIADKIGKFELADKGTIFLDEIGELPLELQPKLLRVLQEGEFDRLGDNETTKVNIRVIAATNRDLEAMVKEGKFREDLYYRLNVFPVHNIPLRERKSDIPVLAQHFLEKYSAKSGKSFKRLSKKTLEGLSKYDFPGNIRELENIIERAVIIESGNTLFPGPWMPLKETQTISKDRFLTFEEQQKQHILEVLFHTKWRVSGDRGAARILGMKDKTLFAKMGKLGIKKEDFLSREKVS